MKKYRFYRLISELILELITKKLSHYAPLSHFALRYAIIVLANSRSNKITFQWYIKLRLHRKERGTKMTMIFFFQKARWSCVDFSSVEIILKKYIRRTKLVLVSTQYHRYFNIKFWRCFSVDKMIMFRRSNVDLFNVNVKIINSWAS